MQALYYQTLVSLALLLLGSPRAELLSVTVPNYQAFVEAHQLPEGPIKKILDKTFFSFKDPHIAFKWAGCNFLRSKGKIVAIHPLIPNYVLKAINYSNETFFDKIIRTFHSNRNIYRVAVNEKIKECIKLYNLQHIITPQKYLYHIPGRPDNFSDANYIVISEKLDLLCKNCNKHYFMFHATNDQKREIEIVIRAIGYGDSHLENICVLKNGKIAIIDTEPHGTVDAFTFFPGFNKAVHALSSKVGKDIFSQECNYVPSKKKKNIRCAEIFPETTFSFILDCPTCAVDSNFFIINRNSEDPHEDTLEDSTHLSD